jgi:hypothetical protein
VPVFLTALHIVMGTAKFCEHSGWILIAGVCQIPPLEDTDGGHTKVFDSRIET